MTTVPGGKLEYIAIYLGGFGGSGLFFRSVFFFFFSIDFFCLPRTHAAHKTEASDVTVSVYGARSKKKKKVNLFERGGG